MQNIKMIRNKLANAGLFYFGGEILKYKAFIAILVAASVFLNYATTACANSLTATVNSGFVIENDFSTYYDFELCPADAKVSEVVSETLGSQHTIKWENPGDLPSNYIVEIYAVCEFEIYAPDNWFNLESWNVIENSKDKDWQVVDTPYVKIFSGGADNYTSCIIDFDSLLTFFNNQYTASMLDDKSKFKKFSGIIAEYGTALLGKDFNEIANPYNYVVNENECKDFRFSKMKYFIRYKKAVEPQEPLQEDGKYHYYLETWKPLNKSAGKPSNEFSGLPSGVYAGLSYTGGEEFVAEKGSYLNYHVKYEIISPYPVCLVSGEKLPNYIHSYDFYNYDGSVRYRPFNTIIRTRTESGIQANEGYCQLYVLINKSGDKNEVNPSYGSMWDDIPNLVSLSMLASSGTYQSNIPIFAAAFSSAADDYLLTGKLDSDENGNSFFMPGGGYQYGQLLQCTVGFADGGASLDKNGSITSVVDGNNDTDNGWLKKIYYLLKDNLINDDGDSWLAKIHKRLEWTNTYLKALIAENTIADIGSFITGFISDKLDAAVTAVMDTVNITVITAAGKTITNAAKTKFPFSVYTDYEEVVMAFSAEPVAPKETVNLKFIQKADGSYLVDEDITFDFARFDKIARTTRSACYILFTLGLIPATRKYVQMIDGGKKS